MVVSTKVLIPLVILLTTNLKHTAGQFPTEGNGANVIRETPKNGSELIATPPYRPERTGEANFTNVGVTDLSTGLFCTSIDGLLHQYLYNADSTSNKKSGSIVKNRAKRHETGKKASKRPNGIGKVKQAKRHQEIAKGCLHHPAGTALRAVRPGEFSPPKTSAPTALVMSRIFSQRTDSARAPLSGIARPSGRAHPTMRGAPTPY
ncbi:hypothetical protein Fcan01_23677 [Folsomia candida]|uniref:Secreted protein n=1 Tax=Folsomia candida TaxID=158441 RepID=A0A226D7V4_FOLCA|nr:hypothetical protein Fcan01_23677 [Folsomia candida]